MKIRTRSDTVEYTRGKATVSFPERPPVRKLTLQEEQGDGQTYKCALTGARFAAGPDLHTLRLTYEGGGEPWEFAVCPEIATGGEAALRRAIEQAIENRVLEAAMRLVDALDLHRALQAPFHAACALCSGGHGSNTQCQRPPAVCRNGQGS